MKLGIIAANSGPDFVLMAAIAAAATIAKSRLFTTRPPVYSPGRVARIRETRSGRSLRMPDLTDTPPASRVTDLNTPAATVLRPLGDHPQTKVWKRQRRSFRHAHVTGGQHSPDGNTSREKPGGLPGFETENAVQT